MRRYVQALNLWEEASRRDGCRAGLGGVTVRVIDAGLVAEVRSTHWDKDSKLIVHLADGSPGVRASRCELLTDWPVSCCKPVVPPMKTRRSLRPDQPLLVGRLVILDVGLRSTAPHLGIDVWCPHCHRPHHHGWEPLPFRLDAVSHREPHCCFASPWAESGYHVGLDPSAEDEHRRVIREFEAASRRWREGQIGRRKPPLPATPIPGGMVP